MWGKVSFLIVTLSVLIQDPVLVTVSEEILLIFPEAPVVKSGEAVELTCVSQCPSGRPRWEKTIDLAPGKEIPSHSKTLLRIDKVLEAYEADYKCTITCAGKFSSKEVFLTVYSFPHSPKVELQSLNPVSGQTITLQCSARDLYPCHNINVLWYHNFEVFETQKAEPIWNSGLTCNVISRVNYKTSTRSRDLTFTCQLRLGLNSVGFREQNSSLELHLYNGLHNIWIEPTHTVKRVGDLLSISCSADGDPLPTITWRKVGSGTRTTQHWNITGAHGRSTLFIHELRAQDGGVYICKISSGANSTDRQSSVEVWYGPRNVSIDGGGSARDSEALALTCHGDANPEPNITWRRTDPSAQRRWNISRSRGESELRIDSLRPDDHGIYECVVENKLGEVRLTAQVDVEYGPRNVSIDGGGSARDSEALALTCCGDANPEPNITWRRTDPSALRRWNISRSRGESELRIDSLRPDDHGIYECVVENKLGEVRLTAQVDVEYEGDDAFSHGF
ncbi:vascular cell adhesion protein 1-like [Heterodontus francisci]|uniref:vascular cell adhesion protein 1-like n=1 Tax=Heterodontus francisci TaxID=7792 RepID=UPI00355B4AEA